MQFIGEYKLGCDQMESKCVYFILDSLNFILCLSNQLVVRVDLPLQFIRLQSFPFSFQLLQSSLFRPYLLLILANGILLISQILLISVSQLSCAGGVKRSASHLGPVGLLV